MPHSPDFLLYPFVALNFGAVEKAIAQACADNSLPTDAAWGSFIAAQFNDANIAAAKTAMSSAATLADLKAACVLLAIEVRKQAAVSKIYYDKLAKVG